MRSISLLVFVCLFHASLQAQNNWSHGDWYGIGYKGLSHLRIDEKEIEQGEQTFRFGHLKKNPRGHTIIDAFHRKDLVCFIYMRTTNGGSDWMEAIVFRKGKDSTYIDMIANCPEEMDTDTATMKKMFYACDSSGYVPVRYYDRNTIERFRLLKPVKNITTADLKKARELFDLKKVSLKKKFDKEILSWVEPMLQVQLIIEILVGFGYNPMLSTLEYKNLFSVSM